jgi:hypothetical protein
MEKAIDRRKLIGAVVGGALTAAGLGLTAEATEAQVVVVGGSRNWRHPRHHHRRHRHRRWVCWWHRGRRVCGWR